MVTVWIIILACLFVQGCDRSESEIEQKILAHDSSYKQTLDKRNSLREKLDAQKIVYIQKKSEIDEKIKLLGEKKTQIRQEYKLELEEIKRRIQPAQRDLSRGLTDKEHFYKLKKEELNNLDKDISEITSLIEKKEALSLSSQEIRTWNSRVSSLIKKKEKLSREKDKLKKDIEIIKLKIKVLRI